MLIHYLLHDRGEFFLDLRSESGREAGPDVGGLRGHNTSHWAARVTKSSIAGAVSLVRTTGRDALRLVATTGMRKSMYWR